MSLPTRSPARRRGLLLGLGLALFVLGGLALAGVALAGVGRLLMRLGDPITEFNANLDHAFDIPDDPAREFVIGIVVDRVGDTPADHTLTLTTPEGQPVPTTETTGYHTIFGRDQALLVAFTAEPSATRLIVRAEAGPNEHFVIGREPRAEVRRIQRWAYPAGFACIAVTVTGLALLMGFFVTSSDPDSDMRLA